MISSLRLLRLNNLIFEIAYFENRGPGRIGDVIDAVAFKKESQVTPEIFIKKLDMFEKNYFELLFENNKERHKEQFSFLLQKNTSHIDEFKLGVFYCEDKICDFCAKNISPFDMTCPVEVYSKKGEICYDPMSLLEHSWMREIINLQAKNVFIFPCNYFGKDFKQNYINYLKSKFLN